MAPVLLLDVAAVVLVARTRAGEGDLVLTAPVEQVEVDELRAVVGVDAADREGHHRSDVVEGGHDPFERLAGQAAVLGPARGDVGDRQCPGMLARGVAAVMADQVDLDETRYGVVPVGPRAHRDLTFEQCAGLGA